MKQKLLFFFIALCTSLNISAQVTASPPINLLQCNYEVFDLTTTIPQIIGTQNPNQVSVTFHETFNDAVSGANAITNPSVYVGMMQQMMYARVENNSNPNDYATTEFQIGWTWVMVEQLTNITTCGSFSLPAIVVGSYYTEPEGQGVMLFAGDVITQTMMVYIYAEQGGCSDESMFMVTIMPDEEIPPLADVYSCDSYMFEGIPGNPSLIYQVNGAPISVPIMINQTSSVMVISTGGCQQMEWFTVYIGAPQIAQSPMPIISCSPQGSPYGVFDLTENQAMMSGNFTNLEFSYFETQADAVANANPILNPEAYANINPTSQTVFVSVVYEGLDCAVIMPQVLLANQCTNNTISGFIRIDYDQNGCTTADPYASNVLVSCTHNGDTLYAWTNVDGHYLFTNVQDGNNVISVDAPDNFSASTNQTLTINSSNPTPENVNFCLSVTNPVTDVSVVVYPTSVARPGFAAYYVLKVTNLGTNAASGTMSLAYDAGKLTFYSSSVAAASSSTGSMTFNYGPLLPLQSTSIYINFMVAIPPTVNGGDILTFTATATTTTTDVNALDNEYVLDQTVVNSYDPNDITVLEGEYISPSQADDWLHYVVRFQNTGTAEAINIRVDNKLDEMLDWSTFTPIGSSHDMQVERSGKDVVFRFDGINLPATVQNEPASHGYIVYKVKPAVGFDIGDVISNQAFIFFDFNPAIETNIVTTEIQLLNTVNPRADGFVIYPNPATESFSISNVGEFAAEMFDLLGKKVLDVKANGSTPVDVSGLQRGLYLLKVTTEAGVSTKKLMLK